MMSIISCLLLGCFILGNCVVIKQLTPEVIKVREGDTLILEATVDTHELNLRFTGPGNRVIGAHDHRATGKFQILAETDTGYLLRVWLTIWPIDRFRSGRYALTGFDAYSWEQCVWTVVVQVVPLRHVSVNSPPTCDVIADVDLRCGEHTAAQDVYWEYAGCSVTVRGASGAIVSEFDQCDGLREADEEDKIELLREAAKVGDEQQVAMLLMLGTSVKKAHNFIDVSPLCKSVRLGHAHIAQLLLNAGAPLIYEFQDSDKIFYNKVPRQTVTTAVDCAAWSGSLLLVEVMQARETDLGVRNLLAGRAGGSPILYAAMSGSVDLVKKFILWGEDWKHRDSDNRPVVFFAALSGSVQLVDFLKRLGADLLAKDSYQRNILFYAARSGSLDLVEYLVAAGLQPFEKDWFRATPIADAVLSGSVPVLDAFLKWGGNVSCIDGTGLSLIHYAAIAGHVVMVDKLVALGLDINAIGDRVTWCTPLHYGAWFHNNPSLIRTIIYLGGDVEARDWRGYTPLHMAADQVNPSIVEQLLKANANPRAVSYYDDTPLHTIAKSTVDDNWSDNSVNFEYIDSKSKISNEQGKAPLYVTRSSRIRRVISLLLKAGADPNAVNKRGQTTFYSLLVYRGVPCNRENIEFFVKAGWNVNIANIYGWTLLHDAVYRNDLSCVRILVEAGASIQAVDQGGETPLDIAYNKWGSGQEISEWLEGVGAIRGEINGSNDNYDGDNADDNYDYDGSGNDDDD